MTRLREYLLRAVLACLATASYAPVAEPFPLGNILLTAGSNIHEVVPGQLYRSAQLSPRHLLSTIKKRGIKSILNLREPEFGKEEKHFLSCNAPAIRYKNVPLDAHRGLSLNELRDITQFFRTAPAPLLIHCHWGADRTALAVTLWHILKNPAKQAREELIATHTSSRFGHFAGRHPETRAYLRGLPTNKKELEALISSPIVTISVAPERSAASIG